MNPVTFTLPPFLALLGIGLGTLVTLFITWNLFPWSVYFLIHGDEANDWEFVVARGLAIVVSGLVCWWLVSLL